VIASKQGHLFKFNTLYFNNTKNTDKETDISIQIELIYDKLVIDQVDKLSISKRKTQFLTSSSRNDICVKSFSNENYIYKMLEHIPHFIIMHPLGYNVIIAYKKEIEIVSILLSDFLVMNKIKIDQTIINMKISDSGNYIAVATNDCIHVFDF